MPRNLQQLRKWLGIAAIGVIVIVAGFALRGRFRQQSEITKIKTPLGIEVQQSTEGFTFSKSEGGRTIFTLKASKAVQYKMGGRATLEDAHVVVYGRKSNRFDQIYGSGFEWDPETETVTAKGEVHIDLEAYETGPERPDQAPPEESENPIHLRTSGLIFNAKTGFASTKELIEFRFPQAGGTAVGATYDARTNVLTLESQVKVKTTGKAPANMTAENATIFGQTPRHAELSHVLITQGTRTFASDKAEVIMRDDSTVDRILASGGVTLRTQGADQSVVRAPAAQIVFNQRGLLETATLSGGVNLESAGSTPVQARAGRAVLEFAAGNELQKIRALDNVSMLQRQRDKQTLQLSASGVDFFVGGDSSIQRAVTSGASRVEIVSPGEKKDAAASRTVVTAQKFEAEFDNQSRLKSLRGSPEAQIVSSTPGQPDRTSSSRELTATFRQGQIASLTQTGNVRYMEGTRTATADKATYTPGSEDLILSGSPKVTDAGVAVSANSIKLNRRTSEAIAEGNVKASYAQQKQGASGAMFSGSDPMHATAQRAVTRQGGNVIRFTGGARLWQGANIILAPEIEFNRTTLSMTAEGGKAGGVSTVFTQKGPSGAATPLNVSASRLTYADQNRRARFEGGVKAKGADATIMADEVNIYLYPRGARGQSAEGAPSELERIVAQGNLIIQQQGRRAVGEQLVYTASDAKFELTGGPPVVVDEQRGTITGDSLTFYSRSDTVLVGSKDSRTETRTRVQQ